MFRQLKDNIRFKTHVVAAAPATSPQQQSITKIISFWVDEAPPSLFYYSTTIIPHHAQH
ncbi:hypothetical protein PPL_10929 [Heterostelium album PN500]|uniref:Uncharacterized protein n=1 Tax=Heterostelium pallidum (strain ATCC 26659 / Pp 5 / PN500) TaxID=670386 RepID=D3BSG1_HETP5|nr:hypothetical protein PPL_10929 [Heterostelium album PN500]EFA75667.1 hypothetical protein PPL_10929 [Heterostelium album PN500]|eukprot:XP_020427801.1 hypothetical protein PPL_10929 [Heterostelium album PN500]